MFSIVTVSESPGHAPSPDLHRMCTPGGLFMAVPCTANAHGLYWFYCAKVPPPENADSRDGWQAYGAQELTSFKSTLATLLSDVHGDWDAYLRKLVPITDRLKFPHM